MKIERTTTIVTMSMDEVVERIRQSLMVEDNLQDTETFKLVISDVEDLSNCVESRRHASMLVELGFEDPLGGSHIVDCRSAVQGTQGTWALYKPRASGAFTDSVTELEARRYVALGVLPK